jgi:hypothetical protein
MTFPQNNVKKVNSRPAGIATSSKILSEDTKKNKQQKHDARMSLKNCNAQIF